MLKKRIDDYTPSPYLTFSIHLDGMQERHDTSVCQEGVFDRAVEAIKLALGKGFRVSLQGAQGFYNVKPDLTTLGKVIGGGMPVGAFGGRRDIMECLAPLGSVYQAGTLSGNPVAMAAGLKTLELIATPNQHYLF